MWKWAAGFICFIIMALLAIQLCFSQPYFYFHNLNPIALDFIKGGTSLTEMQNFTYQSKQFTAEEISHFQDVKHLLHQLNIVLIILCFALLVLVFSFSISWRFVFKNAGLWAASWAFIFLTFLLSGQWKPLTRTLHPLLFPDGNWQFPRSSLTIALYPMEVMQKGVVSVFVFSVILIGVGYILTNQK